MFIRFLRGGIMKSANKTLLINHFSSAFNIDILNDMIYDLKKDDGKDMLYVLQMSVANMHKTAEENLKMILQKKTFMPGEFKRETKKWEVRQVK